MVNSNFNNLASGLSDSIVITSCSLQINITSAAGQTFIYYKVYYTCHSAAIPQKTAIKPKNLKNMDIFAKILYYSCTGWALLLKMSGIFDQRSI